MLYILSLGGNILNITLGILIDALIFNIIYSAIEGNVKYLGNVLIYTIGMEIEQMILTRYISPIIYKYRCTNRCIIISKFVIKFIYTYFLLKERMNEKWEKL